jgi:hypothetical protein
VLQQTSKDQTSDRRLFGTLAIGMAIGISAACLWPFHAPKNDVSWLTDGNGLQFGRYGTVMSVGPFELAESPGDRGWSIELAMQAGKPMARRHFLTFYSPSETDLLSLRQDDDAVVVSTEDKREESAPTSETVYVENVFRKATPVFLSITGSDHGTAVFVDGKLRRSSDRLRLSRHALSGQLILGDAPLESNSWSGRIGSLAIYASEMSPMEVFRHFEAWTGEESRETDPESWEQDRPAAMYAFNEGGGSIIHNRIQPGVDLNIPERYTVAGKLFLEGPLHEYNPIWSYSRSIVINILGFVPFGYVWYGYLSLSAPWRKSTTAVVTVILGGGLSFGMEVLQGFLPTRSSGIADIITNTIGTILGVAAYRFSEGIVQNLLNRVQAVTGTR